MPKLQPIGYYGGKQRMLHNILPLIPKHTIYVEPFFGGGTVYFGKENPNVANSRSYHEVINDKSEYVINLYRILQTRYDDLIHLLNNTLYSKSEYDKARQIWRGELVVDDLWKAWSAFVNFNQGFAHQLNSGWARSAFKHSFVNTWNNKVARLENLKGRFKHTSIECDDAINVIRNWDSPHTCFYIDPPYVNTNYVYDTKYDYEEYETLITTLDNCVGSFLLSCYEIKDIRIPHDWECFKYDAVMSVNYKYNNINRKRVEVVYRRFPKLPPKDDVINMYNSGRFDMYADDERYTSLIDQPLLFA